MPRHVLPWDGLADNLTVNEYLPGAGIAIHVDTHSAFEDGICALTLGDGCARLSTSCPKDTQEDADTFDAIVLAICWAIALVLVVVYICTMTTTLIFGTSPSTGMSTDGTVHIHLTGPEAENDGDRIIRQIHQRRGEVMRSYR